MAPQYATWRLHRCIAGVLQPSTDFSCRIALCAGRCDFGKDNTRYRRITATHSCAGGVAAHHHQICKCDLTLLMQHVVNMTAVWVCLQPPTTSFLQALAATASLRSVRWLLQHADNRQAIC